MNDRGANALDVPEMEVLVTAEAEKAPITLAQLAVPACLGRVPGRPRQIGAAAQKAAGKAMFESAVAVADDHGQKEVAINRQLTEQGGLLLADERQILRQACQVGVVPATDGHPVRHAADLEFDQIETAHLHRMIDQIVIIIGQIVTKAPGLGIVSAHAGGDAPVGIGVTLRRQQLHPAGLIGGAVHPQKQAGAVEVAMGAIQVRGTNRQLPGMHLIANAQRTLDAINPPGLLVELDHGQRAGGTRSRQATDITGKVANHVATRNPRRQRQGQRTASGIRDGGGDQQLQVELMVLRARRTDAISNVAGISHSHWGHRHWGHRHWRHAEQVGEVIRNGAPNRVAMDGHTKARQRVGSRGICPLASALGAGAGIKRLDLGLQSGLEDIVSHPLTRPRGDPQGASTRLQSMPEQPTADHDPAPSPQAYPDAISGPTQGSGAADGACPIVDSMPRPTPAPIEPSPSKRRPGAGPSWRSVWSRCWRLPAHWALI